MSFQREVQLRRRLTVLRDRCRLAVSAIPTAYLQEPLRLEPSTSRRRADLTCPPDRAKAMERAVQREPVALSPARDSATASPLATLPRREPRFAKRDSAMPTFPLLPRFNRALQPKPLQKL